MRLVLLSCTSGNFIQHYGSVITDLREFFRVDFSSPSYPLLQRGSSTQDQLSRALLITIKSFNTRSGERSTVVNIPFLERWSLESLNLNRTGVGFRIETMIIRITFFYRLLNSALDLRRYKSIQSPK